jgi:hypothetical protein
MWNTTSELLFAIYDAHHRLVEKKTDVVTAHAEARLLNAATKLLAVNMEHARLTGRLTKGSRSLPTIGIEQDLPAVIKQKPASRKRV